MLTNIRAHVRAYNALNIINKFHFGFCAENACEIIAIANSSGVRCLCERSKSVCLHAHMCVRVCVLEFPLPGVPTDCMALGQMQKQDLCHIHTHTFVYVFITYAVHIFTCVRTHVFSDNKRLIASTENYCVRCNKIAAVRITSMFKHVTPTILTYFINFSVVIICFNCTTYF